LASGLADTIRATLVPIHKEGYRFIAIAAVATLILGWLWTPLFWIGVIIVLWVAYFFRDPARVTPLSDELIISPADGKISHVMEATPPAELGLGDVPLMRVSVFMNVFNCHVNRAPVAGRITKVAYKPGKFLNAELDKASEFNERNGLVIDTTAGQVGVVQIAGLVARRIVCWAKEGDEIGAGERFGLIRFGSRLDIYLPQGATPAVAVGQLAIAGETIVANYRAAANPLLTRTS